MTSNLGLWFRAKAITPANSPTEAQAGTSSDRVIHRLLAGFGLLIGILASVVALTLYQSKKITNSFDNIVDNHAYAAGLATQAIQYSWSNATLATEITLAGQNTEPDWATNQLARNSQIITELIRKIGQTLDCEEEQKLFEAVEQSRRRYTEKRQRIVAGLFNHPSESASRSSMWNELQPVMIEYQQSWNRLLQFEVKQTDREARSARAHNHDSVSTTFLLLVLSLTGAVCIALFTSRRLSREVAARAAAHLAVHRAKNELELRVGQRTQELAESVALLNAIISSAADGLLVLNPQGVKILQNQRNQELWKMPPELSQSSDDQALADFFISAAAEPEEVRRRAAHFQSHPLEKGSDEVTLKDGTILERITGPVLGSDGTNFGRIWTFRDITHRKRMEHSVQQSETKFRALFERARDAKFIIDTTGRIIDVNHEACHRLQYSREEFLQLSVENIATPEHAAFMPERIQQMLQGRHIIFESVHCRRDGTKVPVEINAQLLELEGKALILATCRDLSERKSAEQSLRRISNRLLLATRAANLGIWDVDITRNQLLWDDTMYHLYGLANSPSLSAQEAWSSAVHPEDRERIDHEISAALRGEREVNAEFRVVWPDKSIHHIKAMALVERDPSGDPVRMVGVNWDISERKQAEAELERVHKQLLESSHQAGMAEVATGVLHNVGNVLNSVNVSVKYLADCIKNSKIHFVSRTADLMQEHRSDLGEFMTCDPKGRRLPSFLGDLAKRLFDDQAGLLKELDSLDKNIDHIKEIVAMQQSCAKVSGVTTNVNVTEIIEDALRVNLNALARHQITLIRNFENSLPELIIDRHKVLQILVNLISNSRYACAESPNHPRQIKLCASKTQAIIRISVSDNGVGIAPENLTRVFSHGFTTRKEGHGFGLHSGCLAARQMGGNLIAHSEGPGKGATFTLELPLQRQPEPAEE